MAGGTGRRGEALWDLLDAAVRDRSVEVRYRCAAERLMLDAAGAVAGVVAQGAEEPIVGGVILACGGFEADPVLAETGYEVHDRLRALLTYLPRNPNRPRLPSWAVFDEAARRAGPLNGLLGTPNDYA